MYPVMPEHPDPDERVLFCTVCMSIVGDPVNHGHLEVYPWMPMTRQVAERLIGAGHDS